MQKKIILLTLFISLTCFAAAGLFFFNLEPREKQSEGRNTQNHIGDLRFRSKDFNEVTALQHSMMTAKAGETPPAAPQGNAGAGGGKVEYPQAGRQQPSPVPAPAGADPLRSRIEQKYISRLKSLASGYEGRLNGLVSAALDECSSARKANPNADLSPLINKYYAAARSLEAECDSQFYSILVSFESELKAHSFPLDMAVKAKETYEARKSARAVQITAGR